MNIHVYRTSINGQRPKVEHHYDCPKVNIGTTTQSLTYLLIGF